jgi:murein L,D-transpeptidase YcbB/YkuD
MTEQAIDKAECNGNSCQEVKRPVAHGLQFSKDIELVHAPRSRIGPERNESRARLSRRAALVVAAASGLSACGSGPTRPSPTTRRAPAADNPLRNLREAPRVTVAGEPLNAELLRRFYARHDYEFVWSSRRAQADAMMDVVLSAADHGIAPELFHASLLQRRASFPALRRELLLSHAFLTYADILSKGVMPADRRKDNEALTPGSIDIPALLDGVIGSPDPADALEALAPSTPTYRALRQALRDHRSAPLPRIVPRLARRSASPGPTPADRLRTLEVNLERERWLPRTLPADRVWVNVADQRLILYRNDDPVFSTRVIVGDVAPINQSPEFQTMIQGGFFNPPWVVPADIVAAEYLPRLQRDPTYLERHNMILRPNGEIEQRPGPTAGLGVIMFDMPNRFDVYLHDTPERQLFNRDNRRLSHGCIRVQNPIEFAALLMEQSAEAISEGIAAGGTTTTHHRLPRPVPVFVAYQTAFATTEETLEFRPDFYNRDADTWQRLPRRAQERTVMAEAVGGRWQV